MFFFFFYNVFTNNLDSIIAVFSEFHVLICQKKGTSED